mmetsp:Transcript_55256/g.108093  ORF Transcript_55256/g.108093 Transcript_55256/m.108093 type:complete len:180 (-) Transcript_55256:167-706(-)
MHQKYQSLAYRSSCHRVTCPRSSQLCPPPAGHLEHSEMKKRNTHEEKDNPRGRTERSTEIKKEITVRRDGETDVEICRVEEQQRAGKRPNRGNKGRGEGEAGANGAAGKGLFAVAPPLHIHTRTGTNMHAHRRYPRKHESSRAENDSELALPLRCITPIELPVQLVGIARLHSFLDSVC